MKQQTMSMYAEKGPITDELLGRMDAWFRAANYLSAGQLYLLENPLLKKPLTLDMIKKKIVGHWGTVPGQNFVFVHLNRVIKRYDLDLILLSGPGHGGNFYIANDYLDGTYSEVYPNISQDEAGMQKLFKQFSFPGGVPSHCAPETPGSINEGGELGYGIAHAFGAVFDNPGLIAAVTVGDGEAETGPLATSWQCNKFLNPVTDGADALDDLVHGFGHQPVHGHGIVALHEIGLPAAAVEEIRDLLAGHARKEGGVGDLVAVQVQDGQNRAVGGGVEELVALPGGGQRSGFSLAIADSDRRDQVGIVEYSAKGMGNSVT